VQLACRQDQREPQFALTLGRKTRITITNTYSYSLCGSILILAGDMRGRGSCGGLRASELLDVCVGPALGLAALL
jgi:hypothetical protein